MNKTLNELAKSMRIHSRLLKALWANAVNIASLLDQ